MEKGKGEMNAIVIIPVYQPEPVLPNLVGEVVDNGNLVIVVDDGSDADSQHFPFQDYQRFCQGLWRTSEVPAVITVQFLPGLSVV